MTLDPMAMLSLSVFVSGTWPGYLGGGRLSTENGRLEPEAHFAHRAEPRATMRRAELAACVCCSAASMLSCDVMGWLKRSAREVGRVMMRKAELVVVLCGERGRTRRQFIVVRFSYHRLEGIKLPQKPLFPVWIDDEN